MGITNMHLPAALHFLISYANFMNLLPMWTFSAFATIWFIICQAHSSNIKVNEFADSWADVDACTQTPSICNIRSAFATCASLRTELSDNVTCSIYLPDYSYSIINGTFGSIEINRTANVHLVGGANSRIETYHYANPLDLNNSSPFLVYNQQSINDIPHLKVSNVVIAGFQPTNSSGGAISFSGAGTLHLSNVTFINNIAWSGGSVFVANNTGGLLIEDCTFLGSYAGDGGAITLAGGVVNATISGSSFHDCEAAQYGGSIHIDRNNSDITVSGCVFTDSRSGAGGAVVIFDSNSRVTITGSNVKDCRASQGEGGAIYVYTHNTDLRILDTTFAHCTAATAGGAIYVEMDNPFLLVHGVKIHNSSAALAGGGIFLRTNQNVTVTDTVVDGCNAKRGGGINIEHDSDDFRMTNLTVTNCYGRNGGGIFIGTDNTDLRMTNVAVRNCTAYRKGGGIMIDAKNDHMVLHKVTIEGCRSDEGGGLLHGRNFNLSILNSEIRNCSAQWGGGIDLYSENRFVTLIGTTLADNHASEDGGGMYVTTFTEGLRIGGSNVTRNRADRFGGGIFVESGNDDLLLADGETTENLLVLESEHPYAYQPVIFRHNVSVPGAVSYLLYFDERCSLGSQDSVNVYYEDSGVQRHLFNITGDEDWPGISVPILPVDSSTFTIEMLGGNDNFSARTDKDDDFFGFLVFIMPIFPTFYRPNLFSYNHAGLGGGAISIFSSVKFAIFTNTRFIGNAANDSGGALLLRAAVVGLTMQALVFEDNKSGENGGAVCASSASYGWEVSNCSFVRNTAALGGGAVAFVTDNGKDGILTTGNRIRFRHCDLSSNTAEEGGGLYLDKENEVHLHNCVVSDNNAKQRGGGVHLVFDNILEMKDCQVQRNIAEVCGGGISLANENKLELTHTELVRNAAERGGGMCFSGESYLFLRDSNAFIGNHAHYVGGAMASFGPLHWFVKDRTVMLIDGNFAQRGSALYLKAEAITAAATQDITSYRRLALRSAGVTVDTFGDSFVGALQGQPQTEISLIERDFLATAESERRRRAQTGFSLIVNISNNNASVGGTVYWLHSNDSRTREPELFNEGAITWLNNSAPYGIKYATQLVRMEANVTSTMIAYNKPIYPAPTFTLLDYYGQQLQVDGTVVMGVTIVNASRLFCSGSVPFLDRTTNAVRNVGSQVTFKNLEASCAPGDSIELRFDALPVGLVEISKEELSTYTVLNTTTLKFRLCQRGEVIKDASCVACVTDTYSLQYPVVANTQCRDCSGKRGVDACYEDTLQVREGYWRRRNSSHAVLECIGNINGCLGGDAVGDASCEEGYEGPLCAVCSEGYYSNDGNCELCNDSGNRYSPTVIVFLVIGGVILSLFAFLIYAKYIDGGEAVLEQNIVSVKSEYPDWWPTCCTRTWIRKEIKKMQAQLKIVITTYQIVSSIPENMSVTFPTAFDNVLNAFSVFNLNVMSVIPFSCGGHYTFIDTLVYTTLFPIGLTLIIFLAAVVDAAWQMRKLRLTDPARLPIVSAVKDQYLTYFFFLTYLVLPSVATTIFQTFLCTNVDPRDEDSEVYDLFLIADMSISCTSDYYYRGVAYAAVMLLLYVVGIPLMYYYLLYCNREELMHRADVETTREAGTQTYFDSADEAPSKCLTPNALVPESKPKPISAAAKQISFLWVAYEPKFWYWEVVETTRRLVLTAVLSVCGTGTSAQSILAVLLGVVYIKLYGFYAPYEEDSDDVVAEVGQFQIFFSFLGALIYQNELLGPEWNVAVVIVLILINTSVTALFTYYGCQELKEQVDEAKEIFAADDDEDEGVRVMPRDDFGEDDASSQATKQQRNVSWGAGVEGAGHQQRQGYAAVGSQQQEEEEEVCASKVLTNYFA